MYKPQWVGRKRNRQSTKVPAYSISRVFLMELPYHNTLDTCSNMSKNATNDKIQSPVDSQTCFQLCLRTARHLTVVIVISFILSCYNLFICDRIMFIGCKSKNKIPYHQEKQRLFAKPSLI